MGGGSEKIISTTTFHSPEKNRFWLYQKTFQSQVRRDAHTNQARIRCRIVETHFSSRHKSVCGVAEQWRIPNGFEFYLCLRLFKDIVRSALSKGNHITSRSLRGFWGVDKKGKFCSLILAAVPGEKLLSF